MSELERRSWSAPDGTRFRVSLTEQTITEGLGLRRIRRIEFTSLDGATVGTTVVPGYLSLDLLGSLEMEELWRQAVGRK